MKKISALKFSFLFTICQCMPSYTNISNIPMNDVLKVGGGLVAGVLGTKVIQNLSKKRTKTENPSDQITSDDNKQQLNFLTTLGAQNNQEAEKKLKKMFKKIEAENIDQAIDNTDLLLNAVENYQQKLYKIFKTVAEGLGSTELENKLATFENNKITTFQDYKELIQMSYNESFESHSYNAELLHFIKNFFEPITENYEEIIALKKDIIETLKNNPNEATTTELLKKLLLATPDNMPRIPSINDYTRDQWIKLVQSGYFKTPKK